MSDLEVMVMMSATDGHDLLSGECTCGLNVGFGVGFAVHQAALRVQAIRPLIAAEAVNKTAYGLAAAYERGVDLSARYLTHYVDDGLSSP